ncbi:MAG: type I DNA topoisomerase [Clostridia bacterium]|nr:type I DNA topoisomerase [Clostridia bacterium]
MANAKHLVIVESPSKARTIGKFLGSRYNVVASAGHLRDLPKSSLGVDMEHDFEPKYINVRGKADLIRTIKKEAKAADKVYLATDPDREGEAISWHLCDLLGIDPARAYRVVFPEITKSAVLEGIKNSRPIDMNLVNAQQGRRVMDRIAGYEISPVLWTKIGRGLSAGRVQSAALKIICDREKEIEAFDPQEYWVITADLCKQGVPASQKKKNTFTATLAEYQGKKVKLDSKADADKALKDLKAGDFRVKSLEPYETVKRPYAPYTTSTMQQDASIKLHFGPQKTMSVAQQLYQGVNVKGHGTTGLITYMRTDSVRISDEADAACKSYIAGTYGKEYVGNNRYTNKSSNAQDAHEAIRPSYMDLDPETVKDSLQSDEYKLYKLIWSRFVASRMKPAVYSGAAAEIENGDYLLKAKGSALKFDGYMKVYRDTAKEEKDKLLPPLQAGEALDLADLNGEQKFTQPPARFTEASLIREMEENGIGRPSTYATIVNTLTTKKYVAKEKNALSPTDLGNKITYLIMEPYFKELVDVGFTADMEKQLDKVEEGDLQWQKVVGDYYNGYLKDELAKAKTEAEKIVTEPEYIGENCPQCGRPLVKKNGKFGSFIACSGYPECKYTRNIVVGTGVSCPLCGKEIVVKRSRKGKTFYGCSGYPDCGQVYWYKPVNKKCPKCGQLLVQRGRKLVCSNEECHYSEKNN